MIPGFASAERAWENANPYDGDCTCLEEDLFICPDCGASAFREKECPECLGFIRQVTDDARQEDYPAESCPLHGYTDQDAADDAREHDHESRMGY